MHVHINCGLDTVSLGNRCEKTKHFRASMTPHLPDGQVLQAKRRNCVASLVGSSWCFLCIPHCCEKSDRTGALLCLCIFLLGQKDSTCHATKGYGMLWSIDMIFELKWAKHKLKDYAVGNHTHFLSRHGLRMNAMSAIRSGFGIVDCTKKQKKWIRCMWNVGRRDVFVQLCPTKNSAPKFGEAMNARSQGS